LLNSRPLTPIVANNEQSERQRQVCVFTLADLCDETGTGFTPGDRDASAPNGGGSIWQERRNVGSEQGKRAVRKIGNGKWSSRAPIER
jgi:hypothetical protein